MTTIPPALRIWIPWIRRLAILLALSAIAMGLWRWSSIQARRWMDTSHTVAGWTWLLQGARWSEDGRILTIDSAQAQDSGTSLKARRIRLVWGQRDGGFFLPVGFDLEVGMVQARLHPRPEEPKHPSPKPPEPPRWGLGALPLGATIELDSLQLIGGRGDTQLLVEIHNTQASIHGPRRIALTVGEVRSGLAAGAMGLEGWADWSDADTLYLKLRSAARPNSVGDRDSVLLDAALQQKDLARGRIIASASVGASRSWAGSLPALGHAPAIHQLRLDVDAQASDSILRGKVNLILSTDSIQFLPPLDLSVGVEADSRQIRGQLQAWRRDGEGDSSALDLHLQGDLPKGDPFDANLKGRIRIRDLGMPLRKFEHPFDGVVDVASLDRKGAKIRYRTDAGSLFDAQASWAGLHWQVKADVAPEEPWAVAWVDSLHMDGHGTIHGHDSAGGAYFVVRARQPRIRPIRLDSLQTTLWIGGHGPRLEFGRIDAWSGDHRFVGSGRIPIADSLVHFQLSPESDTGAMAAVDAHFNGRAEIMARRFPSDGLQLDLPISPDFPVVADAALLFHPVEHSHQLRAEIQARVAGRSGGDSTGSDSVVVEADLHLTDSVMQAKKLQLRLGNSALEARFAFARRDSLWTLDTLDAATGGFDLAGLAILSDRLPRIQGKVVGRVGSIRGQGVGASVQATGLALDKDGKKTLLPDLFLWGERDTLHLGGWLPAPGSRIPFRLTAWNLWETSPQLELHAYWADVLRLSARGSFDGKRDLAVTWQLDGNAFVPGVEARIKDLLVKGDFRGDLHGKGFHWKARAEGERGTLQAVAGLPLELRFSALADPQMVEIPTLSLTGPGSGPLVGKAKLDLVSGGYSLDARTRDFRWDMDPFRSLRLGSLEVHKSDNTRLSGMLRDMSFVQTFQPGQVLDLHVAAADLSFDQAKDWKKLSGQLEVDRLLFTREFANPASLWAAAVEAMRGKRKAEAAGTTVPLFLDLQFTSRGDSILLHNNLGEARMRFDLGVSGSTTAPTLNGYFAADSEGGSFGYLGSRFRIDTLRAEWDNTDIHRGQFTLAGFRTIRRSCDEPDATSTVMAETCQLRLSANGNIEDPRLRKLTSDCASPHSGDDGTVGAALALASGCYPQQNKSFTMGQVFKSQAQEYGKSFVNDWLQRQLDQSRDDARWLPDSLLLTEVPLRTSRDQLGLKALYRINPELDASGTYLHTFGQPATLSRSRQQLYDAYGLSLRYSLPFEWIEEPAFRDRLQRRVFLQADIGQELDDNSHRRTTVQPSLRYRWEFW